MARYRKRRYGKRRSKRRQRRRLYRRKKLSTKKYKQWWPDVMYTKYVFSEFGIQFNDQSTPQPFVMANTDSEFGPTNTNVNDAGTNYHFYHNFNLCPKLKSASPITYATVRTIRDLGNPATTMDLNGIPPDIKTTCLRYVGYRIMGVHVRATFRPSDRTNNESFSAPPYVVVGVPWQADSNTFGNYWNGKSTVVQNGVSSVLRFNDVGNCRQGFVRRSRGFGAKSGGQKTISMMMYPWKVYGMSKQQWKTDPRCFQICDSADPLTFNPTLSMALADYNPTFQRGYSFDYKYTVYVRWEGQKFLTPSQA